VHFALTPAPVPYRPAGQCVQLLAPWLYLPLAHSLQRRAELPAPGSKRPAGQNVQRA
jgi:hypothetical protein